MGMDLFIFVGETSGDVHGAALLARLKKMHPNLNVSAVAGPKMRKLGLNLFMPMENFQVMGYSAVFKRIFELIYMFKKTQSYILKHQPKVVLFVDFPGFNLRMAKALRRRGFKNKLIHYICPTVWAHGKKRVFTLAKTLDKLLSIFPFEDQYFTQTTLKPTYVGHPLIEKALEHNSPEGNLLLKRREEGQLVGVFPGSRTHEIKQNFPKIIQACKKYLQKFPLTHFVVSVAEKKLLKLMEEEVAKNNLKEEEISFQNGSHNFEIMHQIDAAIATSGTITFELGAMKVPTVVVYHLSSLNAMIARHVIKLRMPYYCIVNIICNKHIFPELYYLDFTAEKVAQTLEKLCDDKGYLRKNSLEGCQEMLEIMQSSHLPSIQAAREISEYIHEKDHEKPIQV